LGIVAGTGLQPVSQRFGNHSNKTLWAELQTLPSLVLNGGQKKDFAHPTFLKLISLAF
jgi:hypothetical protein